MYAKTSDSSTAALPALVSFPSVSLASKGLTLQTLGSQSAGSSATYSDGVWTVTGGGKGVWTDTTDDCQFAYTTCTGDCAIIAQVTSCQKPDAGTRAGLMIRDNLSASVSKRAWVGIAPAPANLFESRMSGWTENWGGGWWAKRSQPLAPGLPYWLKIERRGNLITTFSSQDGTSWAAVNSSAYADMPSTFHIGLFVCSGKTSATNAATFGNVAFTNGTGGIVKAPAPPASLLASGSSKAITVRWLPSFGATAYNLLRSASSGSGYKPVAINLTAAKTSYVDTAVSTDTTYYYVVRAKNSTGTSSNSPQFGAALLASMINVAVGGTAADSTYNANGDEGAAKAFDRTPGLEMALLGSGLAPV